MPVSAVKPSPTSPAAAMRRRLVPENVPGFAAYTNAAYTNVPSLPPGPSLLEQMVSLAPSQMLPSAEELGELACDSYGSFGY